MTLEALKLGRYFRSLREGAAYSRGVRDHQTNFVCNPNQFVRGEDRQAYRDGWDDSASGQIIDTRGD